MNTKDVLRSFKDMWSLTNDRFKYVQSITEEKMIEFEKQYDELFLLHYTSELKRLTSSQIFIAFQTARIYNINEEDITIREEFEEAVDVLDAAEVMDYFEPYSLDSINLPSNSMYVVFDQILDTTDIGLFHSFLLTKRFIIGFYSRLIDGEIDYWPLLIYHDNEWLKGRNGKSWNTATSQLILSVIETINSNSVVRYNALNDSTFSMAQSRIFKKEKIKPREYYRVIIESKEIEECESEKESRIRSECNYAYDVRGHWNYRILTGALPLDQRTEKCLLKDSRRRIFTIESELDDEIKEVLLKRRIQIKKDEWVSVLKYWTDPHIANEKDGKNQYIPSIKVLKN